tara:strand:- start:1886 stop:2803 length:918 start_codon:yes stop_codon:yes gene_type:complete
MKRIITTFISNDRDIRGVLLLKYNLKKINSKYNFGCIVTEDVSEESIELLKKYKIELFKINFSNILHNFKFSKSHIQKVKNKHLFGKLSIFSLTDYDKVIYLDTDILLLKNIDNLMNKKLEFNNIMMVNDIQATKDYSSIIVVRDKYNSGVIVFKPSDYLYNNCLNKLKSEGEELFNKDIFISDQYIFETLNNEKKIHIKPMSICYNCHPILVESLQKLKLVDNISILHYMVKPKPWELLDMNIEHVFENTVCQELFNLWLQLYLEMISNTYFSNNKLTNITAYKNGYYSGKSLIVSNNIITYKI